MEKYKVQTIFLGPAWPDWSGEVNSRISISHGLKFRGGNPLKTGDMLGTRMVDEDWTIVNMLLKYYKFGFARATEEGNIGIREGKLTRDQAIEIAEKYDGACGDEYIEGFCKYIGIDEKLFWHTVKKFTNRELFDVSSNKPKKKFTVGQDM